MFILSVSFLQTRLRKRGVERKRQSEREIGESRERDRLIARERERGVEKETKRERARNGTDPLQGQWFQRLFQFSVSFF